MYDAVAKMLKIDMSQSTLRGDVMYAASPIGMVLAGGWRNGPQPRGVVEAPLALDWGEPLRLRIFLDKSMIEVFANDRQCVTQMVYPQSREATGIKVFARGFKMGGWETAIVSGQAWDMAPAKFINQKSEKR